MKKRKLTLVFIFLIWLAAGCTNSDSVQNQADADFCRFQHPPLDEIEIPAYQQFKLENGITLLLMEDNRFPVVNFYAMLPVGIIQDPKGQFGLAEITMSLLRSGGTEFFSGDEFDLELDKTGASIVNSIARDALRVSGFSLKDDFSHIFSLFAQMLRKPRFSQDKLQLTLIDKMAEIARREDQVGQIANREFRRLVYGKNHPYGRRIEVDTIGNINRESVVNFYQNHFGPDNMVLALWGDFNQEEILSQVKEKFASWPKKGLSKLPQLEIDAGKKTHRFLSRPGLTQSQVVLGHLGITRDHPDYFACLVLSRILGSGWDSRFMRYLRQEKALAYTVQARHEANFGYPGLFIAQAQTKLERTREAIDLMKEEIKRIRRQEVSQEELSAAKDAVLNSSLFLFDTPDKIIKRLVRYRYYGYPDDYIEKLLAGVEAVTALDVLEAAQKHIWPDELSLLVVSSPEKVEELKSFWKD